MLLFNGCTFLPSRNPAANAFISYWPPDERSTQLRLAVKDNIDMKGKVTSAGSQYLAQNGKPAKADAACLANARQHGVKIVGKTNLSEFAIAPSGVNEYFGTPKSPLSAWRKLIPGGSSCGSAVAISSGLADVAFGTDTAGSVRVPAACCGIVGLKTTHGLIPLDGVFPVDMAHLDTVGPMGIDIAHTGLCIKDEQGVVHFMDASSAKSRMQVTLETDISKCLNWSKKLTGVMFARPLELKT